MITPDTVPWYHVVTETDSTVLVVDGSMIFSVDASFGTALGRGDLDAQDQLRLLIGTGHSRPSAVMLHAPTAISLNLTAGCNLACRYCYADQGKFGGPPKPPMTFQTARVAIDRLFADAGAAKVSIGFIGGEPFLNRSVLHESVDYAESEALRLGLTVTFGVTTNGTMLYPEDIELVRNHRFAVTVSVDGPASLNDGYRPTASARPASAFKAMARCVAPLLANAGKSRVAARATIGREYLSVVDCIEAIGELGFKEIGVSPLRTGPDRKLVLTESDWPIFLSEMRLAAEMEWKRLSSGGSPRFSNFVVAMKQLHLGACRPLPCGAAANYVSVSVSGRYFTCHRTIDNEDFLIGDAADGLDVTARKAFVEARHVDEQEPCRRCWARYLCGGGCHAEVIESGRHGCEYITGWLETCIDYYPRVLEARPDIFD
jgi:uncharacterized protein